MSREKGWEMGVTAVLLGVAQDGGVPQAGCGCPTCRRAWRNPEFRVPVACLGLMDHGEGKAWMIDATPDFPEQLHRLGSLARDCVLSGLLITHAHVGHYAGLIHLGKEVQDTRALPVYVSERMADFLSKNAPWAGLIARGNVELHLVEPGREISLSPRLSVIGFPVPHRDEYSDTLAFLARGAKKALFYCPDIDSWERWERDLKGFLSDIDVALLDGTFFRVDELGERTGEVPHPPVTETVKLLTGLTCDVRFIHLNHTNPLLLPGKERDWLCAQGFRVGQVGDLWELS